MTDGAAYSNSLSGWIFGVVIFGLPVRERSSVGAAEKQEVIFLKKIEEKKSSGLKVIPLGGLEQIGMNITAFEYEDSIIVVDCGLSFPEDDMLGIDLVIPDITYLKNNIAR